MDFIFPAHLNSDYSQFQVLNSHMCLAAATLDSIGLGDDHGSAVNGYWRRLGSNMRVQGLWRIVYVGLTPLTTPDKRSRVGEAGGGQAMVLLGVSASVATALTFCPPRSISWPWSWPSSQSIREVLRDCSCLISNQREPPCEHGCGARFLSHIKVSEHKVVNFDRVFQKWQLFFWVFAFIQKAFHWITNENVNSVWATHTVKFFSQEKISFRFFILSYLLIPIFILA